MAASSPEGVCHHIVIVSGGQVRKSGCRLIWIIGCLVTASPLHTRQGEVLAERQLRYREVAWEGSRRQGAGPTNRNRIWGAVAGWGGDYL